MNIHYATDIIRYGIGFTNKHKNLIAINLLLSILQIILFLPLLFAGIAFTQNIFPINTVGFATIVTVSAISSIVAILFTVLLILINPIVSTMVYHSIQGRALSFGMAFKETVAKWKQLLGISLLFLLAFIVVGSNPITAIIKIFLPPLFYLSMAIILFSTATSFSAVKLACKMVWKKLKTVVILYLLLLGMAIVVFLVTAALLLAIVLGMLWTEIISKTTITDMSLSLPAIVILAALGSVLLLVMAWFKTMIMTIPTIFYASYDQLETR